MNDLSEISFLCAHKQRTYQIYSQSTWNLPASLDDCSKRAASQQRPSPRTFFYERLILFILLVSFLGVLNLKGICFTSCEEDQKRSNRLGLPSPSVFCHCLRMLRSLARFFGRRWRLVRISDLRLIFGEDSSKIRRLSTLLSDLSACRQEELNDLGVFQFWKQKKHP